MISVIYGTAGSGKTAKLMAAANDAAASATGQIIFITDNAQSLGLDHNVKFINLAEWGVKSEDEFIGFIKGMLAANYDIQKVYIDGLCRLLDLPAEKLEPVFAAMKSVPAEVDFIATVSGEKLPAYLKNYALKA